MLSSNLVHGINDKMKKNNMKWQKVVRGDEYAYDGLDFNEEDDAPEVRVPLPVAFSLEVVFKNGATPARVYVRMYYKERHVRYDIRW